MTKKPAPDEPRLTTGAPRSYARRYVCVTHSGPLRALVRRYVLARDPGEPEYVEAVGLSFAADGSAAWRFRDAVARMPA